MTQRLGPGSVSALVASSLLSCLVGCGASDLASSGSATQSVRISEIMYHPVAENAAVDNHEYIELYNRSDLPVDLSGWKLAGDIQYTFPDRSSIAGMTYKIIAKNRTALSAVGSYMLNADEVLGDYAGELDNGGGTVTLQSAQGTTVDSVSYDDGFPWPIGADALGADDEWLGLLPTPITKSPYAYRGRSLERVSYDIGADEISNWVPSPLEGPSPGRANSQSGAPPTIVQSKLLRWSGSDVQIRASDTVKLGIGFSQLGSFSNPQLEYFVDDMQRQDEPRIVVPLTLTDGSYEVALPPQPNNAIVRYRVIADLGRGPEVISPRASDPFTWWAYFVAPPLNTTAPVYQVFINKARWNEMWDNIAAADLSNPGADDHRVAPGGSNTNRCLPRATWDAMVPVTFIYNGIVYDAFARYQGSRWNRVNGIALTPGLTTINPLPDRPTNRVLSWKVDFPDYAPLENKRAKIVLNKLNQACPGLDDTLGERLYGDPSIGVPVQHIKYARLHVNGGYYHYMMDDSSSDGIAQRAARPRSHGDPMTILWRSR